MVSNHWKRKSISKPGLHRKLLLFRRIWKAPSKMKLWIKTKQLMKKIIVANSKYYRKLSEKISHHFLIEKACRSHTIMQDHIGPDRTAQGKDYGAKYGSFSSYLISWHSLKSLQLKTGIFSDKRFLFTPVLRSLQRNNIVVRTKDITNTHSIFLHWEHWFTVK